MPVILPAVKNGMQDQEKDHNGGNGGNNGDKHFDIDKNYIIINCCNLPQSAVLCAQYI